MIAAALLRDLCVGAEALPLIDRSPEGGWEASQVGRTQDLYSI